MEQHYHHRRAGHLQRHAWRALAPSRAARRQFDGNRYFCVAELLILMSVPVLAEGAAADTRRRSAI